MRTFKALTLLLIQLLKTFQATFSIASVFKVNSDNLQRVREVFCNSQMGGCALS